MKDFGSVDRIRRVTVGEDGTGKSIVAVDEEVSMDGRVTRIWSSDAVPTLPCSDTTGEPSDWFPRPGGARFSIARIPPKPSAPTGSAVPDAKSEGRGMHATDTVDLVLVLSGRIWLEVGDGDRVELCAGDTLVQNGAWHGWHNLGDEDCVMAIFLLGADREDDGARAGV